MPENSLHQCQNGCFQVCSNCLPENSKCQECLEYCIITPKVAKDVLEIIQKHESRIIPRSSAIISNIKKVYESTGENRKSVLFILSLIMAMMIAKYSQPWQNIVRISYSWDTYLDKCLFSLNLYFFRSSKIQSHSLNKKLLSFNGN